MLIITVMDIKYGLIPSRYVVSQRTLAQIMIFTTCVDGRIYYGNKKGTDTEAGWLGDILRGNKSKRHQTVERVISRNRQRRHHVTG
jgi:hypothetical protein